MTSSPAILVECTDHRGHVLFRQRFNRNMRAEPITIGRSIAADIVIDDEHAAAMHAAISLSPGGQVLVADLGSLNGVMIKGERHNGGAFIPVPGQEFQIGKTRVRVRTESETLAAEKRDHSHSLLSLRNPLSLAIAAFLVLAGQTVYDSWLSAPKDLLYTISYMAAAAFGVSAVWISLWALLSRVMRGEWRWLRHIAICFGVLAGYEAISFLLSVTSFSFGLSKTSPGIDWLIVVTVALAVFLHLIHASSLDTWRASQIAGLTVLIITGTLYLFWTRGEMRDVNHIAGSLRVFPPSLRLDTSETASAFFESVKGLNQSAKARLDDMLANDPEITEEEETDETKG